MWIGPQSQFMLIPHKRGYRVTQFEQNQAGNGTDHIVPFMEDRLFSNELL